MKIFKFILKLLLVLIIVIGVASGILIYRLSDKSFSEPDYLNTSEKVIFDGNAILSKGIKESKNNNSITLTFEEKEMNLLLKSMTTEMNKNLEKNGIQIKTMYLDIENGHNIKFISYFDIKGFNTSLKGDFKLNIVNDVFEMSVTNIKIGKIQFKKETISSILNRFVSKEELITSLDLAGIKMNVDLSSFIMSFNINDIRNLVVNNQDNKELYTTLIDIFFRVENLIKISELSDNMGISIDLTSFGYNENVDASLPYEIDFDSVNEKVEILLNNSIINVEDATLAATFLTKGYENSSSEVQNYVANIDFSSVGISDNENYVGIIPTEDKTIGERFISQIPSLGQSLIPDFSSFEGLKLDENGWNNFFATSEAVGQMHVFARKENEMYKTSYIGIESLFVDIKNDHFAMYLITSINGKRIVIDFELDANPSNGLRISSSVSAIRIGNDELLDNEIQSVLEFLKHNIRDEWIIIDSENKKMDFDFSLIINKNEELNKFMEYFSNVKTSFVEKNQEGYTLISLNLD